jgi:hypothetical protein
MSSPQPEKRHSHRQPRHQGRRDNSHRWREGGADNRARRAGSRPLPPVVCAIELRDESLEKLALRLRESLKAHPLFETARRVFGRPRYLRFIITARRDANVKFHCCAACGEPFLNAESIIEHHLQQHREALFVTTETVLEPPKGNFTLVALCGACNETLCPPNFHRYTEMLVAHHQRQHKSTPFDEFKARIRMSRDPKDLEAWKKLMSTREEFQCKLCDKKFPSRAEFAPHVAAEHLAALEKIEERLELTGDRASDLKCGQLRRVIASALRAERKPTSEQIARLRRALNVHRLQFFRNAAGHQFINCVQPRLPQPGDLDTALRAEIFRLASAPARRGHKPTRKTLLEHFGVKTGAPNGDGAPAPAGPTEAEVAAAVTDLVRAGFLVEYLDGELDAPLAATKAQTGSAEMAAAN